jgi:hypothetical protein
VVHVRAMNLACTEQADLLVFGCPQSALNLLSDGEVCGCIHQIDTPSERPVARVEFIRDIL